jgi:hypothetical protein
MTSVSDKGVEKIKTHFSFHKFLFAEIRAFYEIMHNNILNSPTGHR